MVKNNLNRIKDFDIMNALLNDDIINKILQLFYIMYGEIQFIFVYTINYKFTENLIQNSFKIYLNQEMP